MDSYLIYKEGSQAHECFQFFGENHLQLNNVVAARIGKGLRYLPAIKGYSSSIVIVWRPGGRRTYNQFMEPIKIETRVVDRVRFDLERADWTQLRVLQFLMTEDTTALSEIDGSHHTEVEPAHGEAHTEGRLSTIPEGTHETEPSEDGQSSVGTYLQHADRDLQESLN
jgi:hypothetical protein